MAHPLEELNAQVGAAWSEIPPDFLAEDIAVLPACDWQELTASQRLERLLADAPAWELFRQRYFPGQRLNLNPATLGATSRYARFRQKQFWCEELEAFPLGQYQRGRRALQLAREQASRLWGGSSPALSGGTTATMSQLASALVVRFLLDGKALPLRVLTTAHEHHGGIGAFEQHPAFEVEYLPDEALVRLDILESHLKQSSYHVVMLSHLTWTCAQRLDVVRIGALLKQWQPAAFAILDITQTVGLLPLSTLNASGLPEGFSVALASAHKWLGAPGGTGLMWMTPDARRDLQALVWAGEYLDEGHENARFEPAGGQDFSLWAGLLGALELHLAVGELRISNRSSALAALFERELVCALAESPQQRLKETLQLLDPDTGTATPLGEPNPRHSGLFSIHFEGVDPYPLYIELGKRGIHVKCIKARLPNGRLLNLLRIGIPYYEHPERIRGAARTLFGLMAGTQTAKESV